MSQHAACKDCDFVFVHGHENQGIPGMAKTSVVEVFVACDKRRPTLFEQARDQLVVLHSLAADVESNLMGADAPARQ
jgi:hypothetical protein